MSDRSATLAGIYTHMRLLITRPASLLVMVILDAAIYLQCPEIVDFFNRPQDIPAPFIYDMYHFVIVGGGSAGAVLAARLSEVCDWNILLLEAGPDETYLSDLPMLYPTLQRSALDWKYRAEPSDKYCLAMTNRQCNWPRGKVLGGSSVLNAMMWVRGNKKDYDAWEKAGNPGWGFKDCLPYFKKSEKMNDPHFRGLPYHGYNGPITVERFSNYSLLRDIYMEAVKEMGMVNKYRETNGPSQEGFAILHGSIRDGLRCSTAKGYLRPASRRRNLHISMNTFVEKILIDKDDKRAYGVLFTKDGKKHYVLASHEVILSAGAINSPQLLKLSGIGPEKELRKHDIEVIQHSPGVGENMQDHVAAGGATFLVTNPKTNYSLSYVVQNIFSVDAINDLIFKKKGILKAMPACEVMGFINSKYQDPKENWPDLQIFLASYSDVNDGGIFSELASGMSDQYYAENYEKYAYRSAGMSVPLVMRPRSRGRLLLRSKDPEDPPKIYPNYYQDERDLEIMVEGLKFSAKLIKTKIMKAINATYIDYSSQLSTCNSAKLSTDRFWKCIARHYTQTIYHPSGTCKMGPKHDIMAVVDAALRVYGIKALRVIDASIIPTIPTGNTNSPTIMIAEKAADRIKLDYLESHINGQHNLHMCDTLHMNYNQHLKKNY